MGHWWKNIKCIIIVRAVFEPPSALKSLTSVVTSFLSCHKDIANLPGSLSHVWSNLPGSLSHVWSNLPGSLSHVWSNTSKIILVKE